MKIKEGNDEERETSLETLNSVAAQILLDTKREIQRHTADLAVLVSCVCGLSCNLDMQDKSRDMLDLDNLTPSGAFSVSAETWTGKMRFYD